MKVVVLQGSPRRGGNTETVVEAVLAGLAEKTETDVAVVRTADRNVSGCREDFACQAVGDSPGCSINDDMGQIYDALLGADLIILASPVFCWGVSAQLKAVLDRLYACLKFSATPPRCLLAGKKTALVVTAAGGPTDGLDVCETMYDRLVKVCGLVDRGRLLCPTLKDPAQTRNDAALLDRARRFGASLAE